MQGIIGGFGHGCFGGVSELARAAGELEIVEAGGEVLPLAAIAGDGRELEGGEIEEHDFARLGEGGVPELLGVAVDGFDVEGVDPAAAVAAGGNGVEIADDV